MAALLSIGVVLGPAVPADAAGAACPTAPPAIVDLDLPRFYGNAAGSVVDPEAKDAHAAAPLNEFVRSTVQLADRAWSCASPSARGEAGRCGAALLAAWAKGGALLGRMTTRQAEYQRKWDFVGLALAWIKLRHAAAPAERAVVEPWLIRLADASRAFFDDPARTRNNHWYWLGLGLAAVGIGADSERHWAMARGIMADAARDIAADGTLPKEMERRSRGLFYHVFAVTPLVVMAELGASRGEAWYEVGGGALHRLVRVCHEGLKYPVRFDALDGMPQERPVNPRAGWLQLYEARFPGRLAGPHPVVGDARRWLGGKVATLRAASRPPEAAEPHGTSGLHTAAPARGSGCRRPTSGRRCSWYARSA